MKQLYSVYSIAKKTMPSLAFAALIFTFSMFFNGINAFAKDGYDITGHYYLPNPEKPGRLISKVDWKITNVSEWMSFVKKLQDLSKSDTIDDTTPTMKQSPIIHISQVNPDRISGNDIYLTEEGIRQFARMPTDVYQYKDTSLRKFLEKEMDANSGYAQEEGTIDLNAIGIIVIYRGSEILNNPNWHVTDVRDFKRYAAFIDKLKPLPKGETLRMELKKTTYDDLGAFIMYLNYPGAPYQILSVNPSGGVRGTKVDNLKFFYEDERNYYDVFKKQAEDILKAQVERTTKSDLKRAQEKF